METVTVLSDVGYRAGINNGIGDGAVHHALFDLFVAHLVDCHVVAPLIEGWGAVAEVAIPLVMSGCTHLFNLGNTVVHSLLGDIRLRLRLRRRKKIPLFS